LHVSLTRLVLVIRGWSVCVARSGSERRVFGGQWFRVWRWCVFGGVEIVDVMYYLIRCLTPDDTFEAFGLIHDVFGAREEHHRINRRMQA